MSDGILIVCVDFASISLSFMRVRCRLKASFSGAKLVRLVRCRQAQWQHNPMRLILPGNRANFGPLKNEQQPSSRPSKSKQPLNRMTRDRRRLSPREYSHPTGLAASIALKKNLMVSARLSLI
jgi:hypothetical protein